MSTVESPTYSDQSIAIIGIGLKLPGANDKVEFIDMLQSKCSGIRSVPNDRWNAAKFTDRNASSIPTKIVSDQGGFIENIHEWDSLEFGISPKEAHDLDVHQMILLSTVLQAFEDAGIAYRGSNCGVFVAGSHEAHNVQHDPYLLTGYGATGAALSIQANRLSYVFDLTGPSLFVDTACSGGMTAMHLARNSLLAGDCDTAVAAGISLILTPNASQSFSKLGTLSPDGLCRAFDAGANGYVRGEGCAVVVLKKTVDAIRDGDHVYAEITGSSINANGRGNSLTMPDSEKQMATMVAAYKQSGRNPADAAYLEAHGTGTGVGDPLEANGVGRVFTPGRTDEDKLPIGSVKTYVGHLETAAGLVSLIKGALTLDAGLLFPSLNFDKPNPKIKWDEYKIKVQTEVEPLSNKRLTADGKHIVSISSFGFGGANAHTVLERYPHKQSTEPKLTSSSPFLFAAGGMTSRSVSTLQGTIGETLSSAGDVVSAALLAKTSTERARGHTLLSWGVTCLDKKGAIKFSEPKVATGKDWDPLTLFVFSGQGPQHGDMGRQLFARFPDFAQSILASDAILKEVYGKSFVENYGLFDPSKTANVPTDDSGVWTVGAIVISIAMFQIALFDLWVALGLKPDAVTGHSVGEIAALYASGALKREQAIKLAIARSRALARLVTVDGTMAALGVSAEDAQPLIADTLAASGVESGLWLSAANSVNAVSVSGTKALIGELVKVAESRGIFARQLRVGGPYHSPLVDICEASFREEVDQIFQGVDAIPTRTFVSTVDGITHPQGKVLGTQYCWDNVRKPVLFKPAIDSFLAAAQAEERNAIIVEVAPHGVLSSYLDEIAKAAGADAERTTIVHCAVRPNPKKGETRDTPVEISKFLAATGEILAAGARNLHIAKLTGLDGYDTALGANKEAGLGLFPFNNANQEFAEDPVGKHIRISAAPKPLSAPMFRMSPSTHPWTVGHEIRGAIVVPAAAYLEAAFESGARTLKNVKVHKALVLSDDTPPKYVGFRPTSVPNTWEFRSANKVTVDESGVVLDTLHASGESYPEPSLNGPKTIAERMGTEDWEADFDLHMAPQTFFHKIDTTGASYTREFAMVSKLSSSRKLQDRFLAYVDPLPDLWTSKDSQGMSIHPGLLDSLLLSTWVSSFSFEDDTKYVKDTYMPSSFDEVSLVGTDEDLRNAKGFVVHLTTLESNDDVTRHNMELYDRHTGKALVVITNLTSPRVKQSQAEEVAYTESWQPRSINLPADFAKGGVVVADAEAEAALAAASSGLTGATPDEASAQVYALDEVREPLVASITNLGKALLTEAAAQGKKVVRVLEVYVGSKKLRLASALSSHASSVGVHLDVVPLRIEEGADLGAAVEGAERVRWASFELVAAVDLLRALGDVASQLESLLVPGGILATAELNSSNKVLGQAVFGGAAPAASVAAGTTSAAHVVGVTRRTTPWLASAAIETPSLPSLSEATKRLQASRTDSGFESLQPSRSLSGSSTSDHRGASTPSLGSSSIATATTTPPNEPIEKLTSYDEQLKAVQAKLQQHSLGCILRSPAPGTLVYYYEPGTEPTLSDQVRELGNASTKLWVVANDSPTGMRGLALAGTIENELPTVKAYGVAFDASYSASQRESVLAELQSIEPTGAIEPLTILRAGEVLQRRIVAAPGIKTVRSSDPWVLALDSRYPTASVEALIPHKYHEPPLAKGEVLIQTDAVALNFKNVLSATGLLPPEDQLSEFGGRVIQLGPGVQRFKVGDRVMGSNNANREGTRAVSGEAALTKVPENMTLQEAATFPIAYGTVWHGMVQLAQVRLGETILIVAAAGGVGLSAIQIAQRKGMEVFCTVGSQEKRDYLHEHFGIPYDHMSNSRSIAQWTGDSKRWLAARGKDGFDVVLNSLQGAQLQAGLDSLATLGRFIDISKRDHLAGTPMSMRHFAKAISYFAIELGLLVYKYPERMAALMDEVAAEHARQPFHHLIGHSFEGAQGLIDAYKLMESGKHIGKIVVDLTKACQPGAEVDMLPPKPLFNPNKSYILLGGCGGLGPRIANFMIAHGARKIVLTGRRGKIDNADLRTLNGLKKERKNPGVEYQVVAADALKVEDMQRTVDVANSMAPVGGVYLMAVTLADDQFTNMVAAKFKKVTDSKIGALNVVRQVLDVPSLDFLFLFSSTAALYWNPGQANYNAAQAYFNRFAAEHKNVISFAVPAISDVGVFAQMVAAKGNTSATKAMLALACTSRELADRISDAIARLSTGQAVPYYVPGNLDWTVSYKVAESCQTAFAHLAEHEDEDDQLAGGAEGLDLVSALLGKVLNLEPEAIEDSAFLSSLGLDSLSASKLSGMLEADAGVKMTQLQLLGPVTVSALRTVVQAAAGSQEPQAVVAAAAPKLATIDLAAELDKLDANAKVNDVIDTFDASKVVPDAPLRILATGATGHLGSAVLAGVLAALPNATVTLLVRGKNVDEAAERVQATFAKYALDTSGLSRTEIVLGDVTQPQLGLAPEDWTRLSESIDVLVQAHGEANHVSGFQSLVGINAYSTSQVLRLAATGQAKGMLYFGSTNMWSSHGLQATKEVIHEDYDLAQLSTVQGGYSQSKWVSENLVLRAKQRGQAALIIRPGVLGASSKNEVSFAKRQDNTFLWRVVAGCALFGSAPEFKANLTETPTDWFSTMVGQLLLSPAAWQSSLPAFHLKSPHALILGSEWKTLDGTPVERLPLPEFVTKFKAFAATPQGADNPLTPLVGLLDNLASMPTFDMGLTQGVLGPNFVECPAPVIAA